MNYVNRDWSLITYDDVRAPIGRQDHQHIAENYRGGFGRDAAKKKRGAVVGGELLERLAVLADDEPQREKRV
jgi:hypothetical protein